MTIFTLLEVISALSFIAMTAYLTGRSRFIMRCTRYPFHISSQITLIVLFAFLSITGNYSALPWGEPLITTRLIGILLAGFTGGPITGFCVGIICCIYLTLLEGIHYVIFIYIVLAGTLPGLLRLKLNFPQITPIIGAGIAFVAEAFQIFLYILFPAETPITSFLIKSAIPTMAISVIGVWLFLFVINFIEAEQDIYGAMAAKLSLDIASRTLPYLRLGFNSYSADITARIIYELTKIDYVSITGRHKCLAFVGENKKNNLPPEILVSPDVQEVIETKTMKISHPAMNNHFRFLYRPLKSSVIVPLFSGTVVVGSIELIKTNDYISELDIRIADGIAKLLSVQIQLAEIDKQGKMLEKAELKALRAQINPHFLFNTINIIMSFCRTDTDKARHLLDNLATLMERAFSNQSEFLTLQSELEAVSAYLEIAKSRFGDRLDVAIHVDDTIVNILIPALSLQPLVENALNHGLFPQTGRCLLCIEAYVESELLIITITDNGVGIPPEKLAEIYGESFEGIGIMNIHKRLKSLYGSEYGLTITSRPEYGTQVSLRIPVNEA